MPIAETLVLSLGSAIAKAILRMWLKDVEIARDRSLLTADIITRVIPELREQRRTERQFERIAENVADRLEPFLNAEYRGIPSNEKESAVRAVVDTINGSNLMAVLLDADLDPTRLEGTSRPAQRISCAASVQRAPRSSTGRWTRSACTSWRSRRGCRVSSWRPRASS